MLYVDIVGLWPWILVAVLLIPWLASLVFATQIGPALGRDTQTRRLALFFGPLDLIIVACLGRTPEAEVRHRVQVDQAFRRASEHQSPAPAAKAR